MQRTFIQYILTETLQLLIYAGKVLLILLFLSNFAPLRSRQDS